SVARKGCRLPPAGAVPAVGQSTKGRRPWRCRPRERSRSLLGRLAAYGQGSCRPRRGGGSDIEGLGQSF
ncbi:hypothetical protein BHE74_00049586, partial [Ensete ventricosum]